jgi:uncharacterized protein (TIGR03435 family)
MLQNLLCERFHLLEHHETQMLPSYTLSIGKAGSRLRAHSSLAASESLTPSASNSSSAPAVGRPGTFTWVDTRHLRLTANDLDIKSLARMLAQVMQEPVVDETGLAGVYDFILDFAPPEFMTGGRTDTEALPDIFAVLRQLGLNLTKTNVPRDLIVVDQANKVPTEN